MIAYRMFQQMQGMTLPAIYNMMAMKVRFRYKNGCGGCGGKGRFTDEIHLSNNVVLHPSPKPLSHPFGIRVLL